MCLADLAYLYHCTSQDRCLSGVQEVKKRRRWMREEGPSSIAGLLTLYGLGRLPSGLRICFRKHDIGLLRGDGFVIGSGDRTPQVTASVHKRIKGRVKGGCSQIYTRSYAIATRTARIDPLRTARRLVSSPRALLLTFVCSLVMLR